MTSEGPVRADIRLVTTLLGQTLVRNEGQQLLDLVERVRAQVKTATWPTCGRSRTSIS